MAHGGFESTLLAESTVARQLDEMQKIATDYRTLEEKLRHVEESHLGDQLTRPATKPDGSDCKRVVVNI